MCCIVIPTINQKALLDKAVEYYAKAFPTTPIYILDNGKQELNYDEYQLVTVSVAPHNYGVAGSWNYLLQGAFNAGHTHAWVLNDDVIVEIDENKLNAVLARYHDYGFWVCRPFYNWSSFVISKDTFRAVGKFDELFALSFFEDSDYDYRMQLANIRKAYVDELNPTVYQNSQSTLADPTLNNYTTNRERYIAKWGGPPSQEKNKQPFDGYETIGYL